MLVILFSPSFQLKCLLFLKTSPGTHLTFRLPFIHTLLVVTIESDWNGFHHFFKYVLGSHSIYIYPHSMREQEESRVLAFGVWSRFISYLMQSIIIQWKLYDQEWRVKFNFNWIKHIQRQDWLSEWVNTKQKNRKKTERAEGRQTSLQADCLSTNFICPSIRLKQRLSASYMLMFDQTLYYWTEGRNQIKHLNSWK